MTPPPPHVLPQAVEKIGYAENPILQFKIKGLHAKVIGGAAVFPACGARQLGARSAPRESFSRYPGSKIQVGATFLPDNGGQESRT